jgi:hypothetical protein
MALEKILCRIRSNFKNVANSEIVINLKQVVKNSAISSGVSQTTVKMYTNISDEEDPAISEEKSGPRIKIDDYCQNIIRRRTHDQ